MRHVTLCTSSEYCRLLITCHVSSSVDAVGHVSSCTSSEHCMHRRAENLAYHLKHGVSSCQFDACLNYQITLPGTLLACVLPHAMQDGGGEYIGAYIELCAKTVAVVRSKAPGGLYVEVGLKAVHEGADAVPCLYTGRDSSSSGHCSGHPKSHSR